MGPLASVGVISPGLRALLLGKSVHVLMNRKRNWRRWYLGCALILAAGCGYVKSGTWEDDPSNWKRVFGYGKPTDVVVTDRSRQSPRR